MMCRSLSANAASPFDMSKPLGLSIQKENKQMNYELYLSRLILNPRHRDVQAGLRDCQQLHCLILKAFPKIEGGNQKAREEFGVLYRIEVDGRRNKLSLLVQSRIQPDW